MSIVAMLLLMSTAAAGGDATDPVKLPLSLADEVSEQQGLTDAPVEKAGRQDDFGVRKDEDDMVVSFAGRVRFSIPFGAAHRNYSNYYYGYYYVENYSSWSDFFNPGWGFEMEATYFFGNNGPGRRRSPGSNYGITVLFQVDEYAGRSETGAAGTRLSVDDMNVTTLQIGGRYLQTAGPDLYYGGGFALGAVHYTQVDGTFSGPLVGPVPTRDRVLRDTYTFASTFRADGGYRLGPLGLTLGMALRIMAPPQEGSNFDMDSGAFWTFDINLGAEIGF